MNHPDSVLLYVEDTGRSAEFFHKLFDLRVVSQSPNFAMLAGPNGWSLGLWARHDVKPAPTAAGGFELSVTLAGDAEVDAALVHAKACGAAVVQEPVRLDFGYTFVVRSPDGHFIRAFCPS